MVVYELPLFPLNTVLFPGMPLQLHIFEDRSLQMINTCIKLSQPFGFRLPELPGKPAALAYLAAVYLQVANHDKQKFLETEGLPDLLTTLQNAYLRDISILSALEHRAQP